MSPEVERIQRLCAQLTSESEAYITTFQEVHESLLARTIGKVQPELLATGRSQSSHENVPSSLLGSPRRQAFSVRGLDPVADAFEQQQTLASESFSEEDFRTHLETYEWTEELQLLLGGIVEESFTSRLRLLENDPDEGGVFGHSLLLASRFGRVRWCAAFYASSNRHGRYSIGLASLQLYE